MLGWVGRDLTSNAKYEPHFIPMLQSGSCISQTKIYLTHFNMLCYVSVLGTGAPGAQVYEYTAQEISMRFCRSWWIGDSLMPATSTCCIFHSLFMSLFLHKQFSQFAIWPFRDSVFGSVCVLVAITYPDLVPEEWLNLAVKQLMDLAWGGNFVCTYQ